MFDPLSMMMMTAGSQFGAANGVGGAGPAGGAGGMGSLGQILQGIQVPEAPDPKMSGGVSGSGLPFKTQVTDLLTPRLGQLDQFGQAQQNLPSLGALIAQAGA